jgi:hypothetical protein
MKLKFATRSVHFARFVTRQTGKFYARAIPYGSYTESAAARALMVIGLGVLAGWTLWTLVAPSFP